MNANVKLKIQVALVAMVVLVGTSSAFSARALFGVGDITLMDIQHDIILEIPSVIAQSMLTAFNDAWNMKITKLITSNRKVADYVAYGFNLTNQVYVDKAMDLGSEPNSALVKSVIAQMNGIPTVGAVNPSQIAAQRATAIFNPYNINDGVGDSSKSVVDVMMPFVDPKSDPTYQIESMGQNASKVYAAAQQGANKDVTNGSGYKSSYAPGAAGTSLNIKDAAKYTQSFIDGKISSINGAQAKPQDNFTAMFMALANTLVHQLDNELMNGGKSTPVQDTKLSATGK